MPEKDPRWVAGATMRVAVEIAVKEHANQARKRHKEPYLGHLFGVASNVIEAGGSEHQAAAALLHDIIEDQNISREELAVRVGREVADIVHHCSEPEFNLGGRTHDETWGDRKAWYLNHLADLSATDPAVLVALADKVNNCEKTARDFQSDIAAGKTVNEFWQDFNAGDSCQQWWYTSLVREFSDKIKSSSPLEFALLNRFRLAVSALFDNRQVHQCDRDHQHGGS